MTGPFDIIIVGGGVIGASCAYHLSRRRDLRVALLDDKRPGNASRASAGGIPPSRSLPSPITPG